MNNTLHQQGSATSLGIARSIVYCLWMFILLARPVAEIDSIHASWFAPFGPIGLLPSAFLEGLLQPSILVALRAATLILCGLLAVGARPFRLFAIPAAVLIFLEETVHKGFNGFLNHSTLALLYAAFLLPLFRCSDGFSIFSKHRPRLPDDTYAASMHATALCLALPYAMLGIRRLFHGGMEIFTGDAILIYLATKSLEPAATAFRYGTLPLGSPNIAVLMKIGFFIVTLAEILTPLILYSRNLRWIWLAVMVPFHISTLFTMNIFFWQNLVIALVFFTEFTHILSRLPSRLPLFRSS
jgi:hypothetical protein